MPVVKHGKLGYVEDRSAPWSSDMATELIHFTWYPEDGEEKKSTWKLPHHRSEDDRAVWRGVVAAAAAILGARGGVKIPRADLDEVKAHIAREYELWGEKAPWERKGSLLVEEQEELARVLAEHGERLVSMFHGELVPEVIEGDSGRRIIPLTQDWWAVIEPDPARSQRDGTRIQTVIFSKTESPDDVNEGRGWTVNAAKQWLKEHNLRFDKVDETTGSYRFRQFPPGECEPGSFRTLKQHFPRGVSAVICRPAATKAMQRSQDVGIGLWAIEPMFLHAKMAGGIEASWEPSFETSAELDIRDGVAVIPIRGVIGKGPGWFVDTSVTTLKERIRRAADDESVLAILLHIESPGGMVAGIGDVIKEIRHARTKKPVLANISDIGASAAYWLASQTDRISADEFAVVGGIGVFSLLYDTSEQFKRAGVKVHLITSGALKGQGAPGVKLKKEFLDDVQRKIDTLFEYFVEDVATGRGMSTEAVRQLADGRTFLAAVAAENGLIDIVESFDEALEHARAVGKQNQRRTVLPESALCFADQFSDQIESMAAEISLGIPSAVIRQDVAGEVGVVEDNVTETVRSRDGWIDVTVTAVYNAAVSDALWERARQALSLPEPKDRYAFLRVIMADTRVNRQPAKFPVEELHHMAELINARPIPLMRDHDLQNTGAKFGRIFFASVEPTEDGEYQLVGYAYVPKRYQGIIHDIADGIQREGSLSYIFRRAQCSLCGEDVSDPSRCSHIPGRTYALGTCVIEKRDVSDVLEFSLVSIPMTERAGVRLADAVMASGNWVEALIREKERNISMILSEEDDMTEKENDLKTTNPQPPTEWMQEIESCVKQIAQTVGGLQETVRTLLTLGVESPRGVAHRADREQEPAKAPGIIHRGNEEWKTFKKLVRDMYKEFEPVRVDGGGGRYVTMPRVKFPHDTEANRYWRQHGPKIFEGFLGEFPNFFQSDAITTKATIPDEFLDMLSVIVREPTDTTFIHWQFALSVTDFGRTAGDTIRIPRYSYLANPTDEASRTLTPGTDITGAGQALEEAAVSLVLKERGLANPVAISSFAQVRSFHDLMVIADTYLRRDYNHWVDNVIRNLFLTASTVLYPNGKTSAASMTSTDTFSKDFLLDIARKLNELDVPTFPDGYYIGVLNYNDYANLVKSLTGTKEEFPKDLDAINRLLFPAGQGVVTGYVGNFHNFHLFVSRNLAKGSHTDSPVPPGVTSGGSPAITLRMSYFFGPGTIGRGIALPVEIRRADETDFQRRTKLIWYSLEAFGALDINADPATKSETRVIRTVCA